MGQVKSEKKGSIIKFISFCDPLGCRKKSGTKET